MFDLQSESYQATGNVSAHGVRNQLGRPAMDRLTLMIRETVQNSWDAREGRSRVLFEVGLWRLSPPQRKFLGTEVLGARPPKIEWEGLVDRAHDVWVLCISDRGTVGLGGPTSADRVDFDSAEKPNFVNFLRNVGRSVQVTTGGGTYGFGKASLFLASRLNTVLVHTHCALENGKVESRFMGAALGPPFSERKRSRSIGYTGRHWWGTEGADGIVDPIRGVAGDKAAAKLGMPEFIDDQLGTSIAIIQPDFGDAHPETAIALMQQAVVRYFWPKFLDRNGPSISFKFAFEGEELPPLKLAHFPPLTVYGRAFKLARPDCAVEPGLGEHVREVWCQRPRRLLGRLAIVVGVNPNPAPTDVSVVPPFQKPSRHVALMRGPNFVVKYLQGPALPDPHLEYTAVFRSDPELESVFAEAEPPTHDDWTPDSLSDPHHRTFIRRANKEIINLLNEVLAPKIEIPATDENVPLGEMSNWLGGLIPTEFGTGALPFGDDEEPTHDDDTRKRGTSTKIRVVTQGDPQLVVAKGQPVITVRFTVKNSSDMHAIVTAEPHVIVMGNVVEQEAPDGASKPEVLYWRSSQGALLTGESVTIAPDDLGDWLVYIKPADDAVVGITLKGQHA